MTQSRGFILLVAILPFVLSFIHAGRACGGVGLNARTVSLSASPSDQAVEKATLGRDDQDRRNLKDLGLSLLLPGLAQLRNGESTRGTAYIVAEASAWTGFAVFRIQGGLRKDSYIQMTRIYAGAQSSKTQNDDYYRLLNTWPSSDLYNEYVVAPEARALYPDDVALRQAYLEAHQVPADQAWAWQTQAAWDRYRVKRSDSQHSYRLARNMVALAVVNRIVAILDTAIYLQNGKRDRSFGLEMVPGESPLSARIQLRCAVR